MSTRLILTLCASAAVLTACATKQQNPIYKYSTQYKGSSPYTTVASNAGTAATTTAATYQTAGQIADIQNAGSATTAYQTIETVPQTQDYVAFANSTSSPTDYVVPASNEATRTLKKCSVTSGVETCELVQVPVSAIQATPQRTSVQSTAQSAYLTQASAVTTSGRLTQVDSECLQAGVSVPCYPQEIPITTQASVHQPYSAQSDNIIMANSTTSTAAPTDAYYSNTVSGTPGYYAVNSAPTVTTASTATVYAEPEYVDVLPDDSYAFTTLENTTSSPALINAGTVSSNSLYSDNYAGGYITQSSGGVLHTVVENDTIYSFSRKTCTSPEEIRAMNGIGSDNYIRLGDTIRLPASQC